MSDEPNATDPVVLVVSRFLVGELAAAQFATSARAALAAFAQCRGFCGGRIGQSMDDPELRVLETTWESVGAYRKALGSYDVKLSVVPFLYLAIDEPSAYEVVHVNDADGVRDFASSLAADASTISLGEAAGANVPPVVS